MASSATRRGPVGGGRTAEREGRYQAWLVWAALVVVPLLVVALVMAAQFERLTLEASLEQATVVRSLLAGEGFSTDVVVPRSLVFNTSLTHHPELQYGPLAILPSAILTKLIGENSGNTFVYVSVLAWLITAWALLAVGFRLMTRGPALLTLWLFTFSTGGLHYAISGDGRIWAMPLLLALVYLFGERQLSGRQGMIWPLLMGLVVGLIALTDYGLIIPVLLGVLPAVAWQWVRGTTGSPLAVAATTAAATVDDDPSGAPEAAPVEPAAPAPAAPAKRFDWRGPVIVLGLLVLITLPWMVRNLRVTGSLLPSVNTYSVVSATDLSPGRSIYRRYLDPGVTPLGFYFLNQRQVALKGLGMLYVLRAGLTQAIEWPVLALVFVALFLPLSDPLRRARSVFVWMFLWHIVLLMFTTTDFGRLVLWVPVACLFAAAALDHLLRLAFTAPRRLWRWTLTPTTLQRLTALAVVGLLILMGLLPQVMGGDQTNPSAANERYLAQITEPDDVIATDDPWRVAWELNRPTLWLPQTAEDLEAIEEATEDDIRVIYFTVRTPNPFSTESGDWWTDARSNQLGYREWLPADSRVQGERILIRPEADATAQPGDEATDAPSGMSDEPAP